jgi:hypothetical protein
MPLPAATFGLGDRAAPVASTENLRARLVRPHSECHRGRVMRLRRATAKAVERIADSGGFLLYPTAGGLRSAPQMVAFTGSGA